MSNSQLSLLLGAIGVLLALASIFLTVLIAVLGALIGLIVAGFLFGIAVGVLATLTAGRLRR